MPFSDDSEQIRRIREMEQILDRAAVMFDQLDNALNSYESMKNDLLRLFHYYEAGDWQKDYADDSAGKLPLDLKRGVLSQDAIYDLISYDFALRKKMKTLDQDFR